ncbi:hypothetical protein COCON_G00106740 [Conger conger]|uniref:Mitochondrial antiviral-signaling protein n=1 Tax=Conger conger TaxID=82655 RepID=A0A9Q1HZQ4_CONCO|nr:hypothetical protein COCON_G00106740 [Conger conger]
MDVVAWDLCESLRMSFASDRLYDGYIRRNMGTLVSKVKVREIMPHLSCLTPSDRDEIDAKRETTGNYNAMQLLLDCLKRRENWPEEFIKALECCEQWTLASEIRAEYESLRPNAAPVAPAVNAHPSPPPDPSPPNYPVQAPLQTPKVENPLPQPDPQSVAISSEQNLAPVDVEASGVAAPSQNPAASSGECLPGCSSQAPASDYTSLPPSLPPASDTLTPGPAVSAPEPQMSLVKPPVQESNMPSANATQQPVENSDPTVNQVVANDIQAHPAQGSSAQQTHTDSPAMSSPIGCPVSEDEFLSKPGTLLSFNVLVHRPSGNPAVLAPVPEEYSGNTGRLQISSSSLEGTEPSGTTVPSRNEPEENHDAVEAQELGGRCYCSEEPSLIFKKNSTFLE